MARDSRKNDNVAVALLPHRWQGGLDAINGTEEIAFDLFADERLGSGRGRKLFDCTD